MTFLLPGFFFSFTGAQANGPQWAVRSLRQVAPTARRQQGVFFCFLSVSFKITGLHIIHTAWSVLSLLVLHWTSFFRFACKHQLAYTYCICNHNISFVKSVHKEKKKAFITSIECPDITRQLWACRFQGLEPPYPCTLRSCDQLPLHIQQSKMKLRWD